MINYLRASDNIKLGDYLHSNGNIDNTLSNDIIGICVIPSKFLPDGLARFMSFPQSKSGWNLDINIGEYKKLLPSRISGELLSWGYLSSKGYRSLVSSCLPDGSFNPDFLIDLPQGNAFQDYKGYENTEKYKKKYGESQELENAFSTCFRISPSYRKSEWYLPAIGELAISFEKKSLINSAINVSLPGVVLSTGLYWSSSEFDSRYAWGINTSNGEVFSSFKDNPDYTRPFLAL